MEEATDMVLARIHLRAVLPLLEDIAAYDKTLQKEIEGWNGVIQFQLPGGEPATALVFRQGRVNIFKGNYPGKKVTLTFKNARQLNEVFQGKSDKNPIPNLRAAFHVAKLLKINDVLGRLEHYMKPDDNLLSNEDSFAFCVKLAIYAMASGIKEVGEHDPELRTIAPHLPNGTLAIDVKDGPSAHVTIRNGRFYPSKGPAQKPNAILEICDIKTAWAMIQGEIDIFSSVGLGDIKIRGFVPLLDGINPLLDKLSYYLSD